MVATAVVVSDTRKALPFLPVANGKPAQVAGYFQRSGDMNHIVMTLEGFGESAAIVFHERPRTCFSRMPSARFRLVERRPGRSYQQLQAGGRPPEARGIGGIVDWRLALLRDRFVPLSQIITVDSPTVLHDTTERRSIFYAESWALVHYLLSQVPDGGAPAQRLRGDDCRRACTVGCIP